MLIDLHAHSSGISRCCRATAEQVLMRAKEAGLDGVVLTNHYEKSYVTNGDAGALALRYIEEFHLAQQCAEKIGMKVFFGMEVGIAQLPGVHMLVYGVEERFVEQHPASYDYTQEQLYRAVKAAGGVLVQAHPFRGGERLQDVTMLDGVEVNCHALYQSTFSQRILEIASQNGLIVTCGGDFHADVEYTPEKGVYLPETFSPYTSFRPECGVYLPDDVTDGLGVGRFLETTDRVTLRIQEVGAPQAYDHTFLRTKK